MKKFLKKIVSLFLLFEGIDHFIVSTIAVIALHHQHISLTHQFSAWFNPLWDYLMGAGTLISGIFIGGKKKNGKRRRRKQLPR